MNQGGWVRSGMVILTAALLLGCAAQGITVMTPPGVTEVPAERIAVMPLLIGQQKPAPTIDTALPDPLDCSVAQLCNAVNEDISGADRTVTRLIQDTLEQQFGDRVLRFDDAQYAYYGMQIDPARDTLRDLAIRFGQKVEAGQVLVGTVWRYRERRGEEGASVAFALYLLDTETGERLWSGVFDKTQLTLTEDLRDLGGFFKRGFKWLNARELARYGVRELLSRTPLTL